MKVIVFLGPPGSGKGTQTRLLSKVLKAPLVGMGDLLRKEIHSETPLGYSLKEYVDRGDLPPWDLVQETFNHRLNELSSPLVIFDGVPRDQYQVQKVEDMLKNRKADVLKVIFLEVPFSFLAERMKERYQCSVCFATYTKMMPPLKDNRCDMCSSSSFIKRQDDQEDIVKKRLNLYQATVSPMVKYYQERNLLTVINGKLSIDKVHNHVLEEVQLSLSLQR